MAGLGRRKGEGRGGRERGIGEGEKGGELREGGSEGVGKEGKGGRGGRAEGGWQKEGLQ